MSLDVECAETFVLFRPPFDEPAVQPVADAIADSVDVSADSVADVLRAAIGDRPPQSCSLSHGSITTSIRAGEGGPTELPDIPRIGVPLDETYFEPGRPDGQTAAAIQDYAECVGSLYESAVAAGSPPAAVIGADPNQLSALFGEFGTVELSGAGILGDELEQLFWLQILSPAVVERLGAATLLDTPAWHRERLADGSILLVAYQNPHLPEGVTAIESHLEVPLETYWR